MKIAFIIKKRFAGNSSPEVFFRNQSIVVNTNLILYVEEELTIDDLATINDTSCVFARHDIDADTLSKIRVPVFIQHEMPYMYIDQFKEDVTYLTDKSYLALFPEAKVMPQYLDTAETISDKEFDLVFIGTNKRIFDYTWIFRFFIARWGRNFFGTLDEVVSGTRFSWFTKCFRFFASRKSFYKFLWLLNWEIRAERRKEIIRQLKNLSSKGVKIAVVSDNVIKQELESEEIALFDRMSWAEVEDLIKRTKITICTTPLHRSILNERFISAIKFDSIPLFEPYPQYLNICSESSEKFVFDYSGNALDDKVDEILGSFDDYREYYRAFREAALRSYSPENYNLAWSKYVDDAKVDRQEKGTGQ